MIELRPVNVEKNYSDILELYVDVYDNDGAYNISETSLMVYVSDGNITAFNATLDISLGITARVDIPINFSAGEWTIYVVAGDNVHFARSTQTTKLYVYQQSEIQILMEYPKVAQEEQVFVVAYLLAEDGSPLVGRNVTFYVGDGENWILIGTAETNASGYATILWTVNLDVGLYMIKATFEGEEYYSGSATKYDIEVVESEAEILFVGAEKAVNVTFSDPATILLKLYSWKTGEPLANETIYLYAIVSDQEVLLGSGATNNTGYVEIFIEKIDLTPGQYILVAKWGGNDDYTSTKSKALMIVGKESVGSISLEISPENVQYTDKIEVMIHAVDDDGEPITNGIITVEILEGDTPIDRFTITVINGSAKFDWTVAGITGAPTTLTIRVIAEENEYYLGGVSSDAEFSVEKEAISISIEVEDRIFVAESTEIRIIITDDEGKPVDSVDAVVYINNVKYDEDIAINGTLVIPWVPSKKGSFTIKVVAGENSPYYTRAEEKITVNVIDKSQILRSQDLLLGLIAAVAVAGVAIVIKKKRRGAIELAAEGATAEALEEGEVVGEEMEEIRREFEEYFGE